MIWVIAGLIVWAVALAVIMLRVKGPKCPEEEFCEDKDCLNCEKDKNGDST